MHAWPEQFAPAALDPLRMDLCRFTTGRGPDAVVLRSLTPGPSTTAITTGLFVLRDVDRAHACVPLAPAIDFVVVPDGGQEAVIALDNVGTLTLWRWPGTGNQPVAQVLTSWPGFRRLAAVRNGQTTEIIGYGAVNSRIRRATWSGGQLGPMSQIVVPFAIGGVQAMDWNGNGNLEFVLTTATGATIVNWNLSPVAAVAWNTGQTPGVSVETTVSTSTVDGDLLVTVAWDGALAAVLWQNATTSGVFVLGQFGCGCVARYDRDGDGDDDILIGDAAHNVVHVLLREPNGFQPMSAPLLTGTNAPDLGIGAVAGGDVDGDGDGDILACNVSGMRLQTFLDAFAPRSRPDYANAEVPEELTGPSLQLPITIMLPQTAAAAVPGAMSLRLQLQAWLADPTTGLVAPQRVVDLELPLSPTQQMVGTTLTVPTNTFTNGKFHLQLHARVVAFFPNQPRRPLPSLLLHVTNDSACEERVQVEVELETTANLGGGGGGLDGGDGGGDGNILGRKTGKHQLGLPPE